MLDSPPPANQAERLALIARLWQALHATKPGTAQHRALTRRIREETDAFRAALDHDDPTKF
jgi:hypothetical protein